MKSDKDVTKIKRVTFFLRHSVCMCDVCIQMYVCMYVDEYVCMSVGTLHSSGRTSVTP